jgi:hypothetical protein
MTPATHRGHDTTPERGLFVAFELNEKTWKLGCTTGHGQKPRERRSAAYHQAHVLQDVAQAKKRFGLPETVPVVSCYEAGREGFCIGFYRPKASPTMRWIPHRLRSIVAIVGPRANSGPRCGHVDGGVSSASRMGRCSTVGM